MLKKFDQKITEGILFTDQYELVMAQLYYRLGLHEKKVQFDYFFRNYPDYGAHKAGYCINAGLEWLIDWMQNTYCTKTDIEILKGQEKLNGAPLFDEDFLQWFSGNGNFNTLTLSSVPEGRVVHADVPVIIVEGPAAMAQILETALLNQINYQVLIATKASRIKEAGQNQLMMEFGARRGQDRGANAGARAAMIGGADFTSNVGISCVLGFPPKGTHAHSLIQLFLALGGTELDAFTAFADLYPDDTILLVDTINTLESGIPNAIKVFEKIKKKGHKPIGIRLDSGDLAYLSIQAAKMLDSAGFNDVKIVLSNELDELVIWQIITQIKEDAPKQGVDPDSLIKRLIYGVGTRLITSAGDGSLGGVYKLAGVLNNEWVPAIKISETHEKTPNPGNKKVWRIYGKNGKATADLAGLKDEEPGKMEVISLNHPWDQYKKRKLNINEVSEVEPLLCEVLHEGKLVYDFPSIETLRKTRENDVNRLDAGVKRLINPHEYHVSLTDKLWGLKQELIKKFKNNKE
jgi:nicotinate phosphoribosyltransferase